MNQTAYCSVFIVPASPYILLMRWAVGRGGLVPPYKNRTSGFDRRRNSRMSNYHRYYVPGGTYFFTCVTYRRRPILTTELGRCCLRTAINDVRREHPFEIVAIVLLPDHWHTVWSLPPGDDKYPLRWMRIEEQFTEAWLKGGGTELKQSPSRIKHRQRGIWHRRYLGTHGYTMRTIWNVASTMCTGIRQSMGWFRVPGLGVVFISSIRRRRRVRHQLGPHRSNRQLGRS